MNSKKYLTNTLWQYIHNWKEILLSIIIIIITNYIMGKKENKRSGYWLHVPNNQLPCLEVGRSVDSVAVFLWLQENGAF